MAKWAIQCPENFEHLQLLMEAELANLEGNITLALSLYEKSIASAKINSFIRDEAMANELTAQCLLKAGFAKASEGYLQAAHYLYYTWGASRKVKDMENRYPLLFSKSSYNNDSALPLSGMEEMEFESDTGRFDAELLDIHSVFKASQAISGELDLEKLLKATLQVLIENSGAQKGFILQEREGEIDVIANSTISGNTAAKIDLGNSSQKLFSFPLSLVNTAFRTNEAIVVDNASKVNPFSPDPYIIKEQPLSIMCVPLPLHDQWKSAVYLENNLTPNVFSEDRIKIIKLLAGQAAISMANARIYEAQKNYLMHSNVLYQLSFSAILVMMILQMFP